MGHKDKNDELREERFDQEEKRQEERDKAFDENDAPNNIGSQDLRREEGDESH